MLLAKDKIVLPLDVDSLYDVERFVDLLSDYVGMFKVGLQLFTSHGPKVLKIIQNAGGKIFFDGKFHDIPNTVAKASEALIDHDIDFFDVHTQGGSEMMRMTANSVKVQCQKQNKPDPVILGITVLTSISNQQLNKEFCISGELWNYSIKLATLAKESGLTGVVASALEVGKIKESCGKDFIVLTPGIRPSWAEVNDQSRIVTPKDAILAGADFLVIGRPITNAKDPVSAAKKVIDEIEQGLSLTKNFT